MIHYFSASLAGPPVSPELVSFYITQDTQKHQLLPELLTGYLLLVSFVFATFVLVILNC